MGRNTGGNPGDVRKSALWGSGNRGGEHRSNALWGKGGRGAIVTMVAVLMLSLGAGSVTGRDATAVAASLPATTVEAGLLERAQASPTEKFRIIVQSAAGAKAAEFAFEIVERQDDRQLEKDEDQVKAAEKTANEAASKAKTTAAKEKARAQRERFRAQRDAIRLLQRSAGGELDDRFDFIGGVSLEMSGRRLAKLARIPGLVITEDVQITLLDGGSGNSYNQLKYTSKQLWAHETGVSALWYVTPTKMPAIAIVDSGIDESLPDFAGRNVKQVNFVSSGKSNGSRDGRGHGSFVAGIAAGSAAGYAGVAPNAPLVSLDVMDDSGSGRTSDVIAATEWIFQNHEAYDIKVANYSLHGGGKAHFYDDPLNKAVSKLWSCRRDGDRGRGQLRQATGPRAACSSLPATTRSCSLSGRSTSAAPPSVERRRSRELVGLRPDAGRLLEAGDLRSRPDDDRPGPGGLDARRGEGEQDEEPRLRRALRDVVRDAGALGHRGSDPRPQPGDDARPGQGCAPAAGPPGPPRGEATRAASARSTRPSGAERHDGVQPERGAEPVPHGRRASPA